MTKAEILSHVDHTLLSVTATEEDTKKTVADAIVYGCASVCIPPRFVPAARAAAEGRIAVCTVIGFPNGYASAETKCFEAREAIASGADEIDTVIPVGCVKADDYAAISRELSMLREATRGKILKVIIETCLLTDDEKRECARIVSESGADYIKTSTGFSTGGATVADVRLLYAGVTPPTRVKAAGGIKDFADAEAMLAAGADRLGTSRLVSILKSAEKEGNY